uniref:Uncharacterized protein n=1 Tax=Leersia perrieri TaxID=77586 RepID=A0A0D9V705_9ORYZ
MPTAAAGRKRCGSWCRPGRRRATGFWRGLGSFLGYGPTDLEASLYYEVATEVFERAKCYDEEMVDTMESSLKKSIRMFVLENDMVFAAMACQELSDLYEAQQQWDKVRECLGKAAEYYGKSNRGPFYNQHGKQLIEKSLAHMQELQERAHHVQVLLANCSE